VIGCRAVSGCEKFRCGMSVAGGSWNRTGAVSRPNWPLKFCSSRHFSKFVMLYRIVRRSYFIVEHLHKKISA